MLTIGLDVHQRFFAVCILDLNGKRVKEFQVRGRWPKLIEELEQLAKPFAICYEASCGYGHLADRPFTPSHRCAVAAYCRPAAGSMCRAGFLPDRVEPFRRAAVR